MNNDNQLEKLESKFLNTIELTTDARFEAGRRLKKLNKLSFITTTIISLGLILIPLLSSVGHNVAFSEATLTNFQIFLAVCVLVFSVSTSTAQYEVRGKDFFDCADKLKIICQQLKLAQIKKKQENFSFDLSEFETKYRNTLSGTESHENIDYFKANRTRFRKRKKEVLSNENFLNKIFPLSDNFANYGNYLEIILTNIVMYASSITLWILEIVFILDMLGITSLLKFMHDKAH